MDVRFRVKVDCTVNGKPVKAGDLISYLSDFLRHTLKLTGTHVGCEKKKKWR